MIKPNEVRRKNLVEYDGRVFEIDGIAEVFPTLNSIEFGIGVVDWNNIRPIPLSEDMLLRFGFKKSYGEFTKEGFSFRICSNEVFTDEEYNATKLCKVDSVHQLQNLFFSLTGEELTVNN